jgi:hypothetical protein
MKRRIYDKENSSMAHRQSIQKLFNKKAKKREVGCSSLCQLIIKESKAARNHYIAVAASSFHETNPFVTHTHVQ